MSVQAHELSLVFTHTVNLNFLSSGQNISGERRYESTRHLTSKCGVCWIAAVPAKTTSRKTSNSYVLPNSSFLTRMSEDGSYSVYGCWE